MRTSSSRLRSDSFQCTFFSSSPSCQARTSEGEALSSAARRITWGPWSALLSRRGAATRAFGTTSSFNSRSLGRRPRLISPKGSVTLSRATPTSYTPRWGHSITWRKVRLEKGGQETFTSCRAA